MTRTLYLIECKSTKGTSVPLSMIRNNQIEGLQEASKHNLVAGILVNFRNENNDTFFILIDEFIDKFFGKFSRKKKKKALCSSFPKTRLACRN